jgi:hypothetical protein
VASQRESGGVRLVAASPFANKRSFHSLIVIDYNLICEEKVNRPINKTHLTRKSIMSTLI